MASSAGSHLYGASLREGAVHYFFHKALSQKIPVATQTHATPNLSSCYHVVQYVQMQCFFLSVLSAVLGMKCRSSAGKCLFLWQNCTLLLLAIAHGLVDCYLISLQPVDALHFAAADGAAALLEGRGHAAHAKADVPTGHHRHGGGLL